MPDYGSLMIPISYHKKVPCIIKYDALHLLPHLLLKGSNFMYLPVATPLHVRSFGSMTPRRIYEQPFNPLFL